MTIASSKNKAGPYSCNGITLEFPYDFPVLDATHLEVYHNTTKLSSGYVVTGIGNSSGGSVVFSTAPDSGTITLLRKVPILQNTSLPNGGAFYAEVIEKALDRQTMIAQQLQEAQARSIQLPVNASEVPEDYLGSCQNAVISAESAQSAAETAQAQAEAAQEAAEAARAQAEAYAQQATNTDASALTTGILPDARLSGNIARISPSLCNGRLTLSSGTPVPTADITAASTLYFTPYGGKQISLWNSTAWQLISFAEVSVSLSSCAASTNYDVFAYLSNGSLALELTVWTDATNRATSLISQDGVYVKSGDATRRYLGTIRTTATAGQCEDSASKRFVWNFYNQQDRHCFQATTYLTYSYSTGDWRVAGGDSSKGLFFVCGLPTVVSPAVEITCKVSSGGYMYVGIMKNGSNYYNQRLDFTSWFTSFMAAPTQMTAGYNYIHVGELVGSGTETGNDWGLWGTIKN